MKIVRALLKERANKQIEEDEKIFTKKEKKKLQRAVKKIKKQNGFKRIN